MAINNPEFNPDSKEAIKAYPSAEETKNQSAGIIKDLFLTTGVPEIMADGLITQEELKKLIIRHEAFAKDYVAKTGKQFDYNGIAAMAGYIGIEGEEKVMRELGINIPRKQIRLEMEDGRIITMEEAIKEMQQKIQNFAQEATNNKSIPKYKTIDLSEK